MTNGFVIGDSGYHSRAKLLLAAASSISHQHRPTPRASERRGPFIYLPCPHLLRRSWRCDRDLCSFSFDITPEIEFVLPTYNQSE